MLGWTINCICDNIAMWQDFLPQRLRFHFGHMTQESKQFKDEWSTWHGTLDLYNGLRVEPDATECQRGWVSQLCVCQVLCKTYLVNVATSRCNTTNLIQRLKKHHKAMYDEWRWMAKMVTIWTPVCQLSQKPPDRITNRNVSKPN